MQVPLRFGIHKHMEKYLPNVDNWNCSQNMHKKTLKTDLLFKLFKISVVIIYWKLFLQWGFV